MKTARTSIMALVLLGIIALAACQKNNKSNTPVATGSSQLSFQLQATNANLANLPADSTSAIAGLTWTAGTANVGKFAFVAKRSGVTISVFSNNLTNVDLFALTPLETYVTLDTGIYKKISITAYLEKTDTIIPLKLSGTFTNDSAKVVPIEFNLTDNAVVQVKTDSVTINGTTDYTALLNLQLDRVTKGITTDDLNKAKVTNGSIIISKSSNVFLYYKMRANIAICGWYQFRWHHKH
jgi:hypothetical protein